MEPTPAAAPAADTTAPATKERAAPRTDAQWTKHVSKHVPANWSGSKEQFVALYHGNLEILQAKLEEAFARIYPVAARMGMQQKTDLENATVPVVINLQLDFSNIEVAQFNGSMVVVEKHKHTASISGVEELNPKQADLFKGTKPAAAPAGGAGAPGDNTVAFDPNAKSTEGSSKAQPKAAPSPANKAAPEAGKKTKAKAATPPQAPDSEAPPAAP